MFLLLWSFTACINITEGHNYVETREDLIIGDVRHNPDALGTAAELLGGGVAGGGLARGVTAARLLSSAPSLLDVKRRWLQMRQDLTASLVRWRATGISSVPRALKERYRCSRLWRAS
jgi:hypothetical protein